MEIKKLSRAIQVQTGSSPAQKKNKAKDELVKRVTHYLEWGEPLSESERKQCDEATD